ncbi:MAG: hypothetical protein ACK4ZS_01070 [Sulfurimicrobium sp.]
MAGFEPVGIHDVGGNGNVLFLAASIGKTQINEFDFVVLDHF